jgi:hypothetical protein
MRPQGIVTVSADGRLVCKRSNLFVNTGLPSLANLLAGVTAGQFVTAIGYGSGAAAPTANDTGLNTVPAYYTSIQSFSFPSPGSVQFNYSLDAADFAAAGMTIQELGLFANSSAIVLPAAIGTGATLWSANSSQSVGALITDSNSNIQRCTTTGTTGTIAPTWATALDGITTDGSIEWTLVAYHNAPVPLIARVSVPAFAYTGSGNYAGTWTLTF